MKNICFCVAIWLATSGLANAEKKQLPPQTVTKLLKLETRVSEVERKWYKIDRKIQEMNNKIFGKGKVAFSKAKGRNIVTIVHDNQMGNIFRIMTVTYTLVRKGKRTKIFNLKRASVSAPMKNKVKAYQRLLAPGDYILEVSARVWGYSPVFTYVNSYKLRVSSRMGFRVKVGRPYSIRAVFRDVGGMNIAKRFKIVFKTIR